MDLLRRSFFKLPMKFGFKRKTALFLIILIFYGFNALSWGFFAHKKINRLAVFTLPPEMAYFYKNNLDYIIESAVAPDKRRYLVKEEGARHFIDFDYYQDSLQLSLPISFQMVDSLVPEECQLRHGVLPWHLALMKWKLTEAFKAKNHEAILKLSAEIGHYIADAHVPLHTCSNYNGQLTNQHGIHGLWESRIPELNFEDYSFWVGAAEYIPNTTELFWSVVFESNTAKDSVLSFEKSLSEEFQPDQKYSFEERGKVMAKVYSREYCNRYNTLLGDQIERRMQGAVKRIGSIWYTCWVDAGQPDLGVTDTSDLLEIKTKETNENVDQHDCSGH